MEEVIKAEQLTKPYGTLLAVAGVTLSVRRGTVFGLLGANGAGKSTAIECILGTKAPDSGTVSILGLNPRKPRRQLFEKVVCSFRRLIIRKKLRWENSVKSQRHFTESQRTTALCWRNSVLRVRPRIWSVSYRTESVSAFLSCLP